jgi:hypothetical protein
MLRQLELADMDTAARVFRAALCAGSGNWDALYLWTRLQAANVISKP